MKKEISILVPFFINDEFKKFISSFEDKLDITKKEEKCIIIYWDYKLEIKGKEEDINNFMEKIVNYYSFKYQNV